jgi:ribosomal-protein-alanine N-acetyltransferase
VIEVRPAREADLAAVHRLREEAPVLFPPVPREAFARQIWGPATYRGRNVVVASSRGRVVGYVSWVERAARLTGDFYVWHLGAHRGPEGHRAILALLAHAETESRRLCARRLVTSCTPGDRLRQRRLRAGGYRLGYDLLDLRTEAPFRFAPPPPRGRPEIRDFGGVDADAFRRLYWRCFRGVWNAAPMTRDEILDLLGDPGLHRRGSFLAGEGGRTLGFAINRSERRDGRRIGELTAIGVVPAARGRGLGAELLRRSLEAHTAQGASAVELRVASPNLPAIALYRRAGFRIVRRLHVYLKPVG